MEELHSELSEAIAEQLAISHFVGTDLVLFIPSAKEVTYIRACMLKMSLNYYPMRSKTRMQTLLSTCSTKFGAPCITLYQAEMPAQKPATESPEA